MLSVYTCPNLLTGSVYKGSGEVRIRLRIPCGMPNTQFYWAVIGGDHPGVYRDWYVWFA